MINYKKYLGVPYKFGGRSIQEGLDCVSLVKLIADEHKIPFKYPDYHKFTIDNFHNLFMHDMNSNKWRETQKQAGAIVAFRIQGFVKHVGLMVDNENFIHIMEKRSVSLDKISNPLWSKRIHSFYKYKGEL